MHYSNIEAERMRLRLSREQLAAALSMSTKTLQGRLHKKYPFSSKELELLSDMTGRSVDYLLGRSELTNHRPRAG